ncbi:folate family ECF transporter S component [Iocasia frigidifontis]|uniref:Folate family ECF transporter S component n=1 Tax=Iocasia fonsfrigidae TaxID=2682810 RepID=A0A8A7KHV2_9FIRM|nr:folate family ECF transporter S component [Iocasia fonsfrigidae]QTL99358.1 folate family ECF transporter S component [Iocasia fonsfrigidae]
MENISNRRIVYMAFLIALSIVLTRILSLHIPIGGVEGIRIGFGGLPIIFTGVLFGPLAGGIVGAVADILGFFLSPMGPYMPHFTLTSFLTGFLPGAVVFYFFKGETSYLSLMVAIAVGQLISSVILVPLFLNHLFGIPFLPLLIGKIKGQLFHVPVYVYLIRVLLKNVVFNISLETG